MIPIPGTLRFAIVVANNTPNLGASPDTIAFQIPGTPGAISPVTTLPSLAESAILDGNQQPGFNGSPIVSLDGARASTISGSAFDGFTIEGGASGSTIRGLRVVNFARGAGIHVRAGNASIYGDSLGSPAQGNLNGLLLDGATGATTGGLAGGSANVISGNLGDGIALARGRATR